MNGIVVSRKKKQKENTLITKGSVMVLLIQGMFFSMMAFNVVMPLGLAIIRQLALIMYMLCAFLLIFLTFKRGFEVMDALELLTLTFLIMASHFFYDIELTSENLFKVASFLVFPFLICVASSTKLEIKTIRSICRWNIVLACILIVYSRAPFAYTSTALESGIYLTLGMDNSNYTGIVLFQCLSLLLVSIRLEKKFKKSIALIALLILYLIYKTFSRMALIAAVVLIAISFISKRPKVSKPMVLAICFAPIVWVPVYNWLFEIQIFDGMTFMGKSLYSGRNIVYANYLDKLENFGQMLFGNLPETMFNNAHNAPLAVYASIGIVGAYLFYSVIIKKVVVINDRVTTKDASVALIGILAIFVHSIAEASIFMGGIVSAVYTFLMFNIAANNYTFEDGSVKEKKRTFAQMLGLRKKTRWHK